MYLVSDSDIPKPKSQTVILKIQHSYYLSLILGSQAVLLNLISNLLGTGRLFTFEDLMLNSLLKFNL